LVLLELPDSDTEGKEETSGHEAPESEGEELGQGVEGQVAARALGVVVGTGELCAGRGEATTGDDLVGHGGHAHGGSGQHGDFRLLSRKLNSYTLFAHADIITNRS